MYATSPKSESLKIPWLQPAMRALLTVFVSISGVAGLQRMSDHQRYMQRALELAGQAAGFTYPNPAVGAVVVRDAAIVGEGMTQKAGEAHAEVMALRDAGEQAQGATLYVTLEPCAHHGRTPPCVDAILHAGIAHVIHAIADPNPAASGGATQLASAGVDMTSGICEHDARYLLRGYISRMTRQRPWIVAKFAQSLDGRIATRTGHSQWITNASARQRAHQLRLTADTIIIGAQTAIDDNPALTVRLENLASAAVSHTSPLPDHVQPRRVVLDSTARVPSSHQLFNGSLPGKTVRVVSEHAPKTVADTHETRWTLPTVDTGGIAINALLTMLHDEGAQLVMVEGGAKVLGSLFDADVIDEVWAFQAPLIVGGEQARSPIGGQGVASVDTATRLVDTHLEPCGDCWLIRGMVEKPGSHAKSLVENTA